MLIDYSSLSPREVYSQMIQYVVPRPIAWVLSDNGNGSHNLAPFSFFNGVTSKPPIISISIGKKRDGSKKDTWRNIEERKHFIVHLVRVTSAVAMNATSQPLEFGESEIAKGGLEVVAQEGFPLPRLAECSVALSCELHRIVEVGPGPQGLVLGEIKQVYLDEAVCSEGEEGLKIDVTRLNPLARLGGDDYASLTEPFTVPRPW